MRRLILFHQLLQSFGFVHRKRNIAFQVAQTLLKIVHTEVVEQVFGLLAQSLYAVLLFDAQFVGVLLLVGTCRLLFVEQLILVHAEVGSYARYLDVRMVKKELLGTEILVAGVIHSLVKDARVERIGKLQSVHAEVVRYVLRHIQVNRRAVLRLYIIIYDSVAVAHNQLHKHLLNLRRLL